MQQNFYLGIDVNKGYADFVILDKEKNVVEDNFSLTILLKDIISFME